MSVQERHNDYDSEPVQYCSKCYSLKIRYEEELDTEYCAECGCSDILISDIHSWEKLYEERYGHRYVVRKEDPRKTMIYRLPIERLKEKVFRSPLCEDMIYQLYPGFPRGLGRMDSVILLFDRLTKDRRLDDVRNLLYEQIKGE